MPCDTIRRPRQTEADRQREVQDALKRLESQLASGAVAVGVSPEGAIVFRGWEDRDGVTDACAYLTLASEGSWEMQQAIATAEMMSGNKVNADAVASGLHSHDGGKTWTVD